MDGSDPPTATSHSWEPSALATLICPVCPHPWGDHDAVSRRFCSAKIAGGSATGCVCTKSA